MILETGLDRDLKMTRSTHADPVGVGSMAEFDG